MAKDDPHFRLRVPEELHARIAEAAKAAGRSMNAEIVARLEASFSGSEQPADFGEKIEAAMEKVLKRLEERGMQLSIFPDEGEVEVHQIKHRSAPPKKPLSK